MRGRLWRASNPGLSEPRRQQLVDARKAARDGLIVDLICNAAVIPPVFNLQGWNGRKVIDGGMTSKAPMPTGWLRGAMRWAGRCC